MSMEEWEIPYEENDFESRYADELDMLEEFDEEGEILLHEYVEDELKEVPLKVEMSAYFSELGIISG